MAVNKNFVIKNGLEVDEGLIFAQNEKVGIGSTNPTTTLDITGQGLRSEDGLFTGILTAQSDFNVGASGTVITADVDTGFVGINQINPEYPLHIVAGAGGTGVFISGTIVADNIGNGASLDASDINATGITTLNQLIVTGDATFQSTVNATDVLVSGALTANAANIYNQFDITNDGTSAYQYASTGAGFTEATNNPTIYLTRGQKYHFDVNASGHPFYIKTAPGTGTGDTYDAGVVNNGAQVGIVTFVPSFDSPDLLYYQCSIHSGMVGIIKIGSGGGGGAQGYWDKNTTGINTNTSVGIGTTTADGAADPNNTTILNAGIVTANYFYGDGSGLTGVGVGIQSGGVGIGTTVSINTINFVGTAISSVSASSSGIATVVVEDTTGDGGFGTVVKYEDSTSSPFRYIDPTVTVDQSITFDSASAGSTSSYVVTAYPTVIVSGGSTITVGDNRTYVIDLFKLV